MSDHLSPIPQNVSLFAQKLKINKQNWKTLACSLVQKIEKNTADTCDLPAFTLAQ